MDTQGQGQEFIVYGTHITENLQHHKASDVQRILEEKGFESDGANNNSGTQHYRLPGNPENNKRTRIAFDDQQFVKEAEGVTHYEE